MQDSLRVRKAEPNDAATIFRLVQALAEFERLAHEVVSTPESFAQILADADTSVEVLLAEFDGQAVGFALFFENFSTFLGRPGLYLEDLFVEPAFRRQGIGVALFQELFRLAAQREYGRIEWSVLAWNEPAIRFYVDRLGATLLEDWRTCRVVLDRNGT